MNGPFGNMFPYTNFHEMNLDWIIQIARDFLDQYSHIQEVITDGETDLNNTITEGEEALNQEKTNILGALEDALHLAQAALGRTATTLEEEFTTNANARALAAISSIPADYTDFYNMFCGINITDAWFTTNNITDCADVPPGMYSVYLNTAGSYNFPSALGQSFVFRSTAPHPQGNKPYRYKLMYCFGNNGYACWAVWGSANPPTWRDLNFTQAIADLKGMALTDSGLTSFVDITPGNYLMTLTEAGAIGFPETLGQSFYLIVSNKQGSGYAYKSFLAFGNRKQGYYTMCTGSNNASNPPMWTSFGNSGGPLSKSDMDSYGFTTFLDIPAGSYFIVLDDAGDESFPDELGLSFFLEVTAPSTANNLGFKTYKAYGNNGNALYTVCNTHTSSSSLPRWHQLTISEVVAGFTQKPLFDAPLGDVKLLLLGDSITRGSGASDLSGTETFTTSLGTQTIYDEGNSWAIKLTSYLEDQYPNIEVINHGWSGISINRLASHIEEFVPEGITHCILGLGVNSEGTTSFDSGIADIITYLESRNIKILPWTSWVGTHPNMSNINTAGRVQAALIHAYQQCGYNPLCVYSEAMDFLDEHNLDIMDVLEEQPGDENVHPNDLGHQILYMIIRKGFGF